MMLSKFKTAIIISGFLFLSIYADESKGYKVVLASFPTFEEAKVKLEQLGEHLDVDDRALQEKYQYEIVARISGKAYIIGVEPLETKAIANEVIQQFQDTYPEAYSNGYFGPTEGAVVLEHTQSPEAIEVNTTTTNIEEANQSSVKPSKDEVIKTSLSTEVKEEKSSLIWLVMGLITLVVVTVGVKFFLRAKKTHTTSVMSVQDSVDEIEPFEDSSMIPKEDDKKEAEVQEHIAVSVEVGENDIFYRLKNNMFFMTLIQELQEASAKKDSSRCRDLMDEVMRYQKNFRQSLIISAMNKAVEDKSFDSLNTLLSRELK